MDAIGYQYEYDRVFKGVQAPERADHPDARGRSAYFYGIDRQPQRVDPKAEVDPKYLLPGGMTTLRLSLVEASDGKIGSLVDQVTLLCSSFAYGKGFSIKLAIQIGGLLTLLCVGTWVGLTLRRERRRAAAAAAAQNQPNDGPPSGGTT